MAKPLTPEAILEIIGEHIAGFTTAATALAAIEALARDAAPLDVPMYRIKSVDHRKGSPTEGQSIVFVAFREEDWDARRGGREVFAAPDRAGLREIAAKDHEAAWSRDAGEWHMNHDPEAGT